MMVMALEAAAQMADPDLEVDGYELRDIVVGNALIVPRDEEGVETMLHLRPWRTGSRATTSAWHEFTIYSRPGREAWSQNCTGLLTVRYKNGPSNSIFADETRLSNAMHRARYEQVCGESTTPESAQRFYDHQFDIGLQLGETFRNLVEINKGENQSACVVRIPDVASTMPHNFIHEHLIHPCTLDAIVQTLLPTVEGPNEKMKVAAIPTYIERLFVSADIPSTPGDIFRTYSLAGYTGLKEAEASVYASTEGWEKPLVVFERIRATRLSAMADVATAGEVKARLRKIAGEFRWKEDISNLENDDIQALCAAGTASPLVNFLQLAAHKNPAMKILEVGAGDGVVTEQILNALAGRDGESTPWFASYLATAAEQDAVDKMNAKFSTWEPYVATKVLKINHDPVEQGLQKGSFDCIVVTDFPSAASSLENAIANARLLLKAGGKLIVSGPEASTLEEATLCAHGFSGVDCLWPAEQSPSVLLSTAQGAAVRDVPSDVLIIQSSNPSAQERALSNKLASQMERLGAYVSTGRFDEVRDTDFAGKACIMLAELEIPLLFGIGADDFKTVQTIILDSSSLTWVTCGGTINCENPTLSLITGLSRTIRQEQLGIAFCTVDLDPAAPVDTDANASFVIRAIRELSVREGDREFAVRAGHMMVPRVHLEQGTNDLISSMTVERKPELVPFKQPGRALTLTIGVPGMMDTLFFKDDELYRQPLKDDDVEIEVRASGLNFMDIMVAMDQIQEPAVGLECSGVVTRVGPAVTKFKPGDRVMTWLLGAFSTYARSAESMVQPIPIGMTFETAASIPMIYCTAYQALVEAARLQKGEKVLIHAAAGGVGQAAVMIAQHVGAEVFVTVGSQAKKKHLMEHYDIAEDHIFNSRDLSFAEGVMRMTGGRGVDVVLNSLAGEALRRSWLCLAWFGRFVELGKKDITGNTGLDMGPFLKNVSFHSVNVIGTLRESIPRASQLFEKTMAFIHSKHCQPVLPINVMSYSQIEEGFRLLQSGKHIGKVVFKVHNDDRVMAAPSPVKAAEFDGNATYVLSGGLGGLGRTLSQWMVDHGARNLAFLSRSGAAKPEAQALLNKLAEEGVQAVAYACDIGNAEQVQTAIAQCQEEMPPIRGVIQAAMSLAVSPIQLDPVIFFFFLNVFNIGRCIYKNDSGAMVAEREPKSPRNVESAPLPAQGHGFLRHALVFIRRGGNTRAGQLRSGQHVPGRPRSSPTRARSSSGLVRRRPRQQDRIRGGERGADRQSRCAGLCGAEGGGVHGGAAGRHHGGDDQRTDHAATGHYRVCDRRVRGGAGLGASVLSGRREDGAHPARRCGSSRVRVGRFRHRLADTAKPD